MAFLSYRVDSSIRIVMIPLIRTIESEVDQLHYEPSGGQCGKGFLQCMPTLSLLDLYKKISQVRRMQRYCIIALHPFPSKQVSHKSPKSGAYPAGGEHCFFPWVVTLHGCIRPEIMSALSCLRGGMYEVHLCESVQ
jgi:hypothetical protein